MLPKLTAMSKKSRYYKELNTLWMSEEHSVSLVVLRGLKNMQMHRAVLCFDRGKSFFDPGNPMIHIWILIL
jgi:hypothetical protein